jgi:hypothetical protein
MSSSRIIQWEEAGIVDYEGQTASGAEKDDMREGAKPELQAEC